jgi:hypothetical protein
MGKNLSCSFVDFIFLSVQFHLRGHGSERIHNGLHKLFTTNAAKQTTLIMVAASNGCKLFFSGFTAPLTMTATRSRVYRKRATKFVKLHRFLLSSADRWNCSYHNMQQKQ